MGADVISVWCIELCDQTYDEVCGKANADHMHTLSPGIHSILCAENATGVQMGSRGVKYNYHSMDTGY